MVLSSSPSSCAVDTLGIEKIDNNIPSPKTTDSFFFICIPSLSIRYFSNYSYNMGKAIRITDSFAYGNIPSGKRPNPSAIAIIAAITNLIHQIFVGFSLPVLTIIIYIEENINYTDIYFIINSPLIFLYLVLTVITYIILTKII